MRFCPFCSAENADELAVCQACGRRLPPLPPRRARNAPPTGVQLPPRTPGSGGQTPPPTPLQPRKIGTTLPPPAASSPPTEPARDDGPTIVGAAPNDDSRSELLNALTPGPAAERRPPPTESRIIADRRRAPEGRTPPLAPTAFARPNSPSQPPPMRATSPSQPPPIRATSPSQPPPIRATSPSQPPPTPGPPRLPPAVTMTKPGFGFDDDFNTVSHGHSIDVEARLRAEESGIGPPPTRIQRSEALVDRPFTPAKVLAVPEIPEPGLVNAARYAYIFARARWQRRGAIRQLQVEIKQDTEALDQVLGALGKAARGARVEGRVFSAENAAISAAEERVAQFQKDHGEVEGRKAEENSKFVDVERERNEKLAEAERQLEEAQRELANLEAQRRALRDKRKELERRLKAYLKAADDNERQAGSTAMGDQRQELRRVAEGHRKEAAALEPDRQDIDRRLGALERPIGEGTAKLDAAKAELDAAKRSLNDVREGHTHRLAELDSEQKRKAREIGLAESEIQRRLVTLGTLVNLNRIEDPQFGELYLRIDRLRSAITARTTEIEKLNAEREAYDRGTLVRGVVTIGGAFVALIALIVILRACI